MINRQAKMKIAMQIKHKLQKNNKINTSNFGNLMGRILSWALYKILEIDKNYPNY